MEDISALESLARIAGLGGLGIGSLVLIFKAILKLDIFHKLNQTQTYNTLDTIIKMTFTVAILGLIIWAFSDYKSKNDTSSMSTDSTNRSKQSIHINNSGGNIGSIVNGDNNKINNEFQDTLKK